MHYTQGFADYKELKMKSKIVAGAVLAILAQAGHTAPIAWASQSYGIFNSVRIDGANQGSPDVNITADRAGIAGAFTNNKLISTANGSALSNLSISDVSNAGADIFKFTADVTTAYTGGTTTPQFAYTVPVIGFTNQFTASDTVLNVGYDYNVLTHLSTSTAGLLTYQDFHVKLDLTNTTTGDEQTFNLFDFFTTNTSSQAGESHTFANAGTHVFNLNVGDAYTLITNIVLFNPSRGDVADNTMNSVFNLSFSDSVTAVPEPETYALMLAGLALVGFSARRKQA